MNPLAAHLAAINAKSRAWLEEDPGNRGTFLYSEDLAHWAKSGITTVEKFEHQRAVSDHSDTYKMVNNFRPRGVNYNALSAAEIEEMTAKLIRRSKERDARKAAGIAREKEALAATRRAPEPLMHSPFAALLG